MAQDEMNPCRAHQAIRVEDHKHFICSFHPRIMRQSQHMPRECGKSKGRHWPIETVLSLFYFVELIPLELPPVTMDRYCKADLQ